MCRSDGDLLPYIVGCMIKFNLNLSDELHKRFKLICVHQEKDMSEVVRKLIEEYVEKAEKKLKK